MDRVAQLSASAASAPRHRLPPSLASLFLITGWAVAMVLARQIPAPPGLPPECIPAAVLVGFTIATWASGLLQEPLPSLLFFLFAIVFKVAPAATAFSGFESAAWWLVLGGAITGAAVRATGLGDRIGALILSTSSRPYSYYISVVVCAAVGLAFVMPSTTGRVLLLTPIALSLAERLGLAPGRPGHTGLVLAVAAGSYIPPTSILPANIPNSVLLGSAEALYDVHLHYGSYFLLHFPVLGALKTVLIIWLICRLFPDRISPPEISSEPRAALTAGERRLIGILMLSLLGYATDLWHGISPAWISLAAGICCVIPTLGILTSRDFTSQVHLTPLLYVAGFLSLGAVIAQAGLGAWASAALLHAAAVEPGSSLANLLRLGGIDTCLGFLTTLPGLPAVLTPLAADFAHASGLPLYTVLMLQVPVFSTVFLPYQSPPMMIAMHQGGVPVRAGVRLCLCLAVPTLLVLLPLDLLWWKLVGMTL